MKRLLTYFSFLLWTVIVYAQNNQPELNLKFGKPTMEEMQMTEYAADPEADAVVLMKTCDVNYTLQTYYAMTLTYKVRMRIKVLKEEGKRFGDITIPIYRDDDGKMMEELSGLTAVAYNLNEKGKVVSASATQQHMSTEQVNENYHVRKISVPQVKEGTVIEVKYELTSPFFQRINDYILQERIPVLYAKYQMEIPSNLQFNVQVPSQNPHVKCKVTAGSMTVGSNSGQMRVQTLVTNRYEIEAKDMPALKSDNFVYNAADYSAKVVCDLKSITTPQGTYAYGQDWKKTDELILMQQEIGPRLNDKSKLAAEIREAGIAQLPDDKKRIAALVDLLLSHVAWDGHYALLPASESDVLKKKSGTSADLSMMLVGMLNVLDMKSSLVFVSTRRHGKMPIHPSTKAFNTIIVAVESELGTFYVDATDPCGDVNMLDPNLYVPKARMLSRHHKGEWVDLTKTAQGRTITTVTAELNADGLLTGECVTAYSGNAARSLRRGYLEAKDSLAYVSALQKKNQLTLQSLSMEGHQHYGGGARRTLAFEKQIESAGDHIYLSPMLFSPIVPSPFTQDQRELPVELPNREDISYTLEIRLPAGYEIEELPAKQEATNPDRSLTFSIAYEDLSDAVRLRYRFNVKSMLFEEHDYPTLKAIYDMAASHAEDMIVLKKK